MERERERERMTAREPERERAREPERERAREPERERERERERGALPRGQLVLLLAGAGPGVQGQFADGRQVADHLVELAQLAADLQELPGVRGEVLHVRAPRLLHRRTSLRRHTTAVSLSSLHPLPYGTPALLR